MGEPMHPIPAGKALEKVAIVGLNNHGDFLPLLDDGIREIVTAGGHDNEACQFLDAASLTLLSESIGSIPATDTFDELPPLPEETRHPPPTALLPFIRTMLKNEAPVLISVTLLLLYRSGCTIPEDRLLAVLELGGRDRMLRHIIGGALSARGRWLITLNETWQGYCQPCSAALGDLSPFALAETLNTVQRQPPDAALTFIREQWGQVSAVVRLRLVPLLRTLDHPEAATLLADAVSDRSGHVRREVRRALACRGIGDLRRRAAALLPAYLKRPKMLRRKLEVELPEEDTPELQAIGVGSDDYAKLGLAKAVQRLGQLLVIAGPHEIATALGFPLDDTYKRIARSRFGGELEYFLLEAAIGHASVDAVAAWALAYPKPKAVSGAELADILERAEPGLVSPTLISLATRGKGCGRLLTHPRLWHMLFLTQQDCDRALTAALLPGIIEALSKEGWNQDRQEALLMATLFEAELALAEVQAGIQREGGTLGSLDDLLKVLQLKQGLTIHGSQLR